MYAANHYGPGVISSISDDLEGFLHDPDKGTKVHTKIVCTIGPASWSYDGMMGLLKAGMICARLNFSHGAFVPSVCFCFGLFCGVHFVLTFLLLEGDHEGHQKVVDTFRQVCKGELLFWGKFVLIVLKKKKITVKNPRIVAPFFQTSEF